MTSVSSGRGFTEGEPGCQIQVRKKKIPQDVAAYISILK